MKHLVLIGLMGAGKSTVGRRCARRLDRSFVDTDEVVVTNAGVGIDEIFERGGEAHFRELERAAVADVCAAPPPLVTRGRGAGGGVGWWPAPAATLATRVGDGSSRPLLRDGPAAALARLERVREPA